MCQKNGTLMLTKDIDTISTADIHHLFWANIAHILYAAAAEHLSEDDPQIFCLAVSPKHLNTTHHPE